MPVSVAIPAYRNETGLAKTLERIFACRPLPEEVLIHFDGGWQPTRDFSADTPVPVRLFHSSANLGPGGGRDALFRQAKCEIVCSFDDDSWPLDADYFQQALAIMEAFPQAGVISPAVYLREKPVLPRLPEVSEGVSFEGSASITRMSVYLKVPGYVPVAKAYGVEEVDLSLQVHAAGYLVMHCPWLRAWHDRPYADNEHSTLPWIRNEVLLAYLRYPRWFQPWGWLRSIRHVVNHYTPERLGMMLGALASSFAFCAEHEKHVHRYRFRDIWKHRSTPARRWSLRAEENSIKVEPAERSRRILYVQYTNPAAYPPLQHSSQILASAGWEVEFYGVSGRGAAPLAFPPYPRIRVHQVDWCPPGFRQKLHYLRFILGAGWRAWKFKPDWIYASDALSANPARFARRMSGARVVYHEHDTPLPLKGAINTGFARYADRCRRKLGMDADAIVLPNEQRLKAFVKDLQPRGQTFCVWNCPTVHDVPQAQGVRPDSEPLRVVYHGSIVPDRFPLSFIHALAQCRESVCLCLIGYEVSGTLGYTDKLRHEAVRLGVGDRFSYLGSMSRFELLPRTAEHDVGMSLLRIHPDDINMQHMPGASNKPFDYLSQGLAIIVPHDPEWEKMYVSQGCAKACEASSTEELSRLLDWMATHRDEVRAMGRRGMELVSTTWNYEAQFQPLFDYLHTSPHQPQPHPTSL
ncbi:MAG: glycosyltransferase [Verrucomicrobiaceae bacterium]|nr:glycosyltransferase [Verrucomicrobiaceae bacterium]